MKTMKKILGLFLVSIAFVSCGSDDDGPVTKLETVQKELNYTNGIQGFSNAEATSEAEVKFTLELKDKFEFSNDVTASKWVNLNNYFMIEGYKNVDQALILKNVKITVGNGQPVNLGTCKVDAITSNKEFKPDTKVSYEEHSELFKSIFTGLTTGAKKVDIKIQFTPTQDVSRDKLAFVLNVNGDITYKTYPNGK